MFVCLKIQNVEFVNLHFEIHTSYESIVLTRQFLVNIMFPICVWVCVCVCVCGTVGGGMEGGVL